MSEMTPVESFERVREGLKRAASCARQLAVAQAYETWTEVANNLEKLLHTATHIYEKSALTDQEALALVDRRAERIAEKLN